MRVDEKTVRKMIRAKLAESKIKRLIAEGSDEGCTFHSDVKNDDFTVYFWGDGDAGIFITMCDPDSCEEVDGGLNSFSDAEKAQIRKLRDSC